MIETRGTRDVRADKLREIADADMTDVVNAIADLSEVTSEGFEDQAITNDAFADLCEYICGLEARVEALEDKE